MVNPYSAIDAEGYRQETPPGANGYIEEMVDGLSGYPYAVRDAVKRFLFGVDLNSNFFAKFAIRGQGVQVTRAADGFYDIGFEQVQTVEGNFLAFKDQVGRIIALYDHRGRFYGQSYDIKSGSRLATIDEANAPPALTARVDKSLSAYGLPLEETYGAHTLRETHQRLRALSRGDNVQFSVGFGLDSWTNTSTFWLGDFCRYMVAKYGDAGPGYVSFGFRDTDPPNGNARPEVLSGTRSGAGWTCLYGGAAMPDSTLTTSSTAGDRQTLAYTLATPAITTARLHYSGTGGVIRYSWNGGTSWTSLTLSGTGSQTADLTGIPSGTWSLIIEVVSGACSLGGVDVRASTPGVRIHKLGAGGVRCQQWAAASATDWQASMTALGLNAIALLQGTNSQSQYAADLHKTYTATIIDRLKAALPVCDMLLITSPENNRVNTRPMTGYAEADRQNAYEKKVAHVDLQYAFGDTPALYADGSARPWIASDSIHPSTAGGRVVFDRTAKVMEAM